MFKSRKKQNYSLPIIKITPEFAKIAGYYVADGSITGGSVIAFTVCNYKKELELIELMQRCYGEHITYSH